jgi:hypothetical protein
MLALLQNKCARDEGNEMNNETSTSYYAETMGTKTEYENFLDEFFEFINFIASLGLNK